MQKEDEGGEGEGKRDELSEREGPSKVEASESKSSGLAGLQWSRSISAADSDHPSQLRADDKQVRRPLSAPVKAEAAVAFACEPSYICIQSYELLAGLRTSLV